MSSEHETRPYRRRTLAALLADTSPTRVLRGARRLPRGVARAPAARPVAPRPADRAPRTVLLATAAQPDDRRRETFTSSTRGRWLIAASVIGLAALGLSTFRVSTQERADPNAQPPSSAQLDAHAQPPDLGDASRSDDQPRAPDIASSTQELASEANDTSERVATEAIEVATAVGQLRAGDYSAALRSYRSLQRQFPERRVFAVIASVLQRRTGARCALASEETGSCEASP